MTQKVLIAVADGSEDMEVVIIADVLRRANIAVTLASVSNSTQLVLARQLKITTDALLSDVAEQEFDMIVLPGGLPGAEHLSQCELLIKMLKEQEKREAWIAAICASPALVLKKNGICDQAYMTCYPSFQEHITEECLMADDAVVIDEHYNLITSQSPGTAMRFAITLIEELQGFEAAEAVEEPLYLLNEDVEEEEIEHDENCNHLH